MRQGGALIPGGGTPIPGTTPGAPCFGCLGKKWSIWRVFPIWGACRKPLSSGTCMASLGGHLIASDMLHLLQGSWGAPRVPPSARSQQHVPSHPPASVTPPLHTNGPNPSHKRDVPLLLLTLLPGDAVTPPKPPWCQKKPQKLQCHLDPSSWSPASWCWGAGGTSARHHTPSRGGTQSVGPAQFEPKPKVFS